MSRLWSSGFELNSTTANMEYTSVGGSGSSIQTSTVRSGIYALKVLNAAGSAFYAAQASDQAVLAYARVYLFITTLPSADVDMLQFLTNAVASCGSIRLRTSGALRLLKSNGTQLGSDSTTLNTGQWYRIELKNDATASPGSLDARINGSSFASGANSNQGSWKSVGVGLFGAGISSGEAYFDDWAINDSSGSFQNSWPGDGKIIHLKPSASGDSNGYLVTNGGTAGASNNFTRVQEVTPDDATTYNASVLLNAEDLYNVDNSGIGASDTVNVVSVGGRFADLVAADATTAFKFEVEKTGSGTKTQSAAIIANSTTWRTNATATPFNYPITTYQDPDSSNWTQSTLDSMQIGMIVSAAGIRTTAISTIWVSVDYTPAAGATVTPNAIASTTTFYSPTITTGVVTVTPNALASTTSLYNPTVTAGAVTVTPNAISSSTSIPSPTITTGSLTLLPNIISSNTTIPSPTISVGVATVTPSLIGNSTTFYNPTLTTGSVTVSPNLLSSTTSLYSPNINSIRPYRLLRGPRTHRGPRTTRPPRLRLL